MLERWTRAVHRFRLLVLAVWLAVLVVGVWSATRLPALLSTSFGVPGTDSARGGKILTRSFGERTDGGFVVVFRVGHPSDRALRARLRRRLARAARAVPTGQPGVVRAGGGILFGDVDTTLDLQRAKGYTDDLRRALRARAGPPAYVTGLPAIQHDLDPVLSSDVRRGESIALPIALLVLVTVFGVSLAVAIPFLFAACTITSTLALVYGLAHVFSMVTYVTNLVELVGLGLAIDYSLLIVHRFREELALGLPTEDAIVRTMATAGRAVVFSGVTVAVGLGLLLFMPVPFIRSMGFGGFLIPLASIAAALTLQPALLSLFGRRGMGRAQIGRFVHLRRRRQGATDVDRGFWARLARAIMRRPKVFLAAGAALLLAAAAPAFFLRLTPGSISGIPGSLPSVRAFELLRDGIGSGAVTPTQVVVDAGAPGRARGAPTRAAVKRLADELFHDPEALLVASGFRAPYVDGTGRYARVIVAGRHEYGDRPTQRFVTRLRHRLVPGARFPAGVRVYAAGAPAQGADFVTHSYRAFPWLVLAVLVLTYLILLRAFRSVLLPLKAVVLNLLSIAAVYGLLVIVFRWGVGAGLLGLDRTGQVEGWIPIFLFAMLFGLSTDYEVFLVMRMRESWQHVADNARAVAQGLERTGRIITAAAAIMVAAFSGFVAGRVTGLQQFGLGLALAVLVDATIVRVILVPSIMALLGRYSWWMPRRATTAPE